MLNRPASGILVIAGLSLFFAKLLYDLYSAAAQGLQPNLASDAFTQVWPAYEYAKSSVASGVLPLWNPYASLGTPFLGDISWGLLYPLNWTFLFTDVPTALLITQFLSVLVGMAGMYCYTRYLGLALPARIMAVLVFAYAVFTESFFPTLGASFSWFPAVLWLGHRFLDRPRLLEACYLALAVAASFLGGFPNFFYYTCLILSVYFATILCFNWREYRLPGLLQRAGWGVLAIVLMLGLVAVQLLPMLELSSLSVRNITAGPVYDADSVWESFSLLLVLQNFLQTDLAFVYGNSTLSIPAGLYYLGGVLLFVPFAFCVKRHRPVVIALTASVIFFSLFLLSYAVSELALLQRIPLASSLRANGRGAAYIQFLVIVIAVIGFSVVCEQLKSTVAQRFPWAWMLLIVVVLDVSIHRENRFLVPAFNSAEDPFAQARIGPIRAVDDYSRVLFAGKNLVQSHAFANLGTKFQIPNLNAYVQMTMARWANYLREMSGPDDFDRVVSRTVLQRFYGNLGPGLLKLVTQEPRTLELASVRYLYAERGDVEYPDAMPRAYAVTHYVATNSEAQSLAAIKDNASILRHSVVLEGPVPSFERGEPEASQGSVVIDYLTPNEVALSVDVAEPSVVVLTDAFFPGWTASVDGDSTPILRANSLFRAVEVAPGAHRVLFQYRPASFWWGLTISLLSLALVVVAVVVAVLGSRFRGLHREPKTR